MHAWCFKPFHLNCSIPTPSSFAVLHVASFFIATQIDLFHKQPITILHRLFSLIFRRDAQRNNTSPPSPHKRAHTHTHMRKHTCKHTPCAASALCLQMRDPCSTSSSLFPWPDGPACLRQICPVWEGMATCHMWCAQKVTDSFFYWLWGIIRSLSSSNLSWVGRDGHMPQVIDKLPSVQI